MIRANPKPKRCESSNHPANEPRTGRGRPIYTCPYCDKMFCGECEGVELNDGLDDACDDCWMDMDTMFRALRGDPWLGEPDDPDNGRTLTCEAHQ